MKIYEIDTPIKGLTYLRDEDHFLQYKVGEVMAETTGHILKRVITYTRYKTDKATNKVVKSGRRTLAYYQCPTCAEDPELHGDGIYKTDRTSFERGSTTCGCSRTFKPSEEQRILLAKRICDQGGLEFVRLDGKQILFTCLENSEDIKMCQFSSRNLMVDYKRNGYTLKSIETFLPSEYRDTLLLTSFTHTISEGILHIEGIGYAGNSPSSDLQKIQRNVDISSLSNTELYNIHSITTQLEEYTEMGYPAVISDTTDGEDFGVEWNLLSKDHPMKVEFSRLLLECSLCYKF